jgi:hypothetical protein
VNAPRRLRVPLLLAVFLTAGLTATTSATADVFGPISLVSVGVTPGGSVPQQFEYAHDAAISGNGRYVAFDGSFGGVTGVWRRDLLTGAVEQVAGGDAELPSISEDGRYISFTTSEGKALASITNDQVDTPEEEAANVYVRDMSVGPQEAGAFTVASAPTTCVAGSTRAPCSVSEEPLTYPAGSPGFGSTATGRSAISGDGREVAFVTTAVSDLTDPQTPSVPTTPALQVAVRYLDSKETKLVSVNRETGGPVSGIEAGVTYGAVFNVTNGAHKFEPPASYGQYEGAPPPPGASISADGSTVAWMGANIGQQAPLLAAEARKPYYTEPLWRRIAPGSETPTERVTGGSDPQNPACAASGEPVLPGTPSAADPCQGPFAAPVTESGNPTGILSGGARLAFVPRLSGDGYTVAFVSEAPPVALSEFFGSFGQQSDLYVANMHPGFTRDGALTPLTELASAGGNRATDGGIFDFDISADGSQVAFVTQRTQFTLGSPAFVSTRASEPGMEELFDADLRNGTLTRVTQGIAGGLSERPPPVRPVAGQDPYNEGDGALSPSLSASGEKLAFSSTASNLVWGDGNTPSNPKYGKAEDGGDAFVVERRAFLPVPTQQYVSPANEPLTSPAWQLGVTALSRRDGTVLLYVRAPAAGTVRADAQSEVIVHSAHRTRSSGPARAKKASRRRAKPTVASRTVASRREQNAQSGLTTLVLKLAKPYSALASQRGGLSATVTVTLAVAGQHTLRQSIPVTFLRIARTSSRAKRTKAKAGHR